VREKKNRKSTPKGHSCTSEVPSLNRGRKGGLQGKKRKKKNRKKEVMKNNFTGFGKEESRKGWLTHQAKWCHRIASEGKSHC